MAVLFFGLDIDKFFKKMGDVNVKNERFESQIAFLRQELRERDETIEALKAKMHELEQENCLDSKLQIPHKRAFASLLDKELRRTQREAQPISVMMIDVDSFKQYNDYYGHEEGDRCLLKVTDILSSALKRPADLLARYGGDEFCAMLPNTDLKGAMEVAEDMQKAIAEAYIEHADSLYSDWVTVTIGVTSKVPTMDTSVGEFLCEADADLYLKKRMKKGHQKKQQMLAFYRLNEKRRNSVSFRLIYFIFFNFANLAKPFSSS